MWIDPPSGWLYGFPKKLPVPEPRSILEWLVSEGYPQKLIDEMGSQFCYRCFYGEP